MLELLFAGLAAFARARAQTFDVYSAKTKAPTLIFVHGGAWVSGNRAQYRRLGEAFANAGICTVVVEYHLAPAARHPRPVEDLETARAAFAKERRPQCDPKRVVMMGHSAGAHMIATWATAHAQGVRGFVGLEGIYDVPKLAERWPDYANTFLKDEFGARATWAAASPTRAKFSNRAPWLVVHSTGDELVDGGQSRDFVEHLRLEKIKAETFEPVDLTHFDVVQRLERTGSAEFQMVKKFIDRVTAKPL